MTEYGNPEQDVAAEERHREERRAVEEAGGGESEGFELDEHTPAKIIRDAEGDEEATDSVYGEADQETLTD